MKTKFVVERAIHLPSARTFCVEGRISAGRINAGDVVQIEHSPGKTVRVKSVALLNTDAKSDTLTLSIEEPDFPLRDLEGAELVSDE